MNYSQCSIVYRFIHAKQNTFVKRCKFDVILVTVNIAVPEYWTSWHMNKSDTLRTGFERSSSSILFSECVILYKCFML